MSRYRVGYRENIYERNMRQWSHNNIYMSNNINKDKDSQNLKGSISTDDSVMSSPIVSATDEIKSSEKIDVVSNAINKKLIGGTKTKSEPTINRKSSNKRFSGKQTKSENNDSKDKPVVKSVTTHSSSVTPSISNKFSNFDNSLGVAFNAVGWNELVDGTDIWSRISQIYNNLGIETQLPLDKRGEILSRFSHWVQLLKARINNSTDVFILDHKNVDKSLSSEVIFDNFHRQRRPFNNVYSGVPQVSATKYPDIAYNLLFLDISTNFMMQNMSMNRRFAATYSRLKQVLTNPNGYQSRAIIVDDSVTETNSLPGHKTGLRFSSYGKNGISTLDTSDNRLYSCHVSWHAQWGSLLDPALAPSVEFTNKSKTVRKMFKKIRLEAEEYALKQRSGDNSWFSPTYLIGNETTLAATINAVSDLKTFLYIINDAITGALSSQVIKATKVGTPDSTYINFTGKSSFFKQEYTSAYNELWSYFKNIPVNMDVIRKWDQFKCWTKFNSGSLLNNDNTLQIPVFNILRSGGVYYDNDGNNGPVQKDMTAKKKLEPINNWSTHLFPTLIYTAQTLDGAAVSIPQGDWLSYFIQSIIIQLNLSSFVRPYPSRTLLTNTSQLYNTTAQVLNVNETKNRYISSLSTDSEGNPIDPKDLVNVPTGGTRYQRKNGQDLEPTTINGSKISGSTGSDIINDTYGTGNVFFDMTVSYHTMTGFMAAFMDLIVATQQRGELDIWASALASVNPYFSRLSHLVNDDDAYSFKHQIKYIDLQNLPKPIQHEPDHNLMINQSMYYPNYEISLTDSLTWEPTRFNLISDADKDLFSQNTYKLLGRRYSMMSKDGKADRDIFADNIMATINGLSANNLWGSNTSVRNVYQASHAVSRPNAYMFYIENADNTGKSLFPVYIGDHVGSYFYNVPNTNYSNITYLNGGFAVNVGQLHTRSLLINSDDDLTMSIYPGAFNQAVRSQFIHDMSKFIEYSGLQATSGTYLPTKWLQLNIKQGIIARNIMNNYNNNSSTIAFDEIAERAYGKFDSNNLECVPSTKFNLL